MRAYELAKELGLTSKEFLAAVRDMGVELGSHMSALDDKMVELIREAHSKAALAVAKAPAAAAKTTPVAAKAVPVDAKAVPVAAEPPVEEAPPPPTAAEPPQAPVEAVKPTEIAEKVPEAIEAQPLPPPTVDVSGKTIRVKGPIVVKDLADSLGVRPNRLIAELMGMNILASINERLDVHLAKRIAEKHGFTLEHEKKAVVEHRPKLGKIGVFEEPEEKEDASEDMMPRPPVVTFLGHVDHGKTSLLDKIRNTHVTDGESGGITQHIGAYTVDVSGRSITFLDTPGHQAFTAMRARGANLTDIAVIVVAADDGIMPQTREAISHARAAEVALIVALNKMDLPGADPDRAKQQLQAEGLSPEEWGGETICCPVSAQTGKGIDHLLEMILLQADVLELRANPGRRAHGYVIEASLAPGMGPTANLLVTAGTLKVGDAILCGRHWGRVRALINDHGIQVKAAGPATPIKCLGLSGVPEAGAEFRICASDKTARAYAEKAAQEQKSLQLVAPKKASLDTLFDRLKDDEKLELNVILKADTQGSVEAIDCALREIKSDKISLRILLADTGNIHSNDIMLASASDAVVLGFHVAMEPGVDSIAKREGVQVYLHSIIYELIDQVRDAMTGLLAPQVREKIMGQALIKQVFPIGKTGKVAGCMVTSGVVQPRFKARVKRGADVLYEGTIDSLKRFQNSAGEVKESQECGIRLVKFLDFAEGDIIEFYELEEVKQTL